MKIQVMTPNHPKWENFCERLSGPDGCNFKKDSDKWKCFGNRDKRFARKILADLGVDIEESCAFFELHGGFCDCEILFNVEESFRRGARHERARKG